MGSRGAIVDFVNRAIVWLAVFALVAGVSCGTGSDFPRSNHVFVLMEENHGFAEVFPNGSDCSSSAMPYLCSLGASNGIATNFYSNSHGSLLAYLMSTSGSEWTDAPALCNGNRCAAPGAVDGNNLVRALNKSGQSWRGYFEDMPEAGYLGGNTAFYVDRHNPFVWYSDVAASSTQRSNMVPFSQFAADLKANSFANFNYIVPNLLHDGHGRGRQSSSELMSGADSWLKANIAPLLASPAFQAGGDGVLFITFDESALSNQSGELVDDFSCSSSEPTGCGGHVPFVVVSPMVSSGAIASSTYHFEDLLHTVLSLLGLPHSINASDGASNIKLIGKK
jgi:phospholipase C